MKNLFLFLFCLSVSACKEAIMDVSPKLESESFEEVVDDSNDDSDYFRESETLETRANSLVIKTVFPKDSVSLGAACERFLPSLTGAKRGYAKLKTGTGADGTEFEIRGLNFGAVQGDKIIEVELPSGTAAVPLTVVSWDSTRVVVKLPRVPSATKNVLFKIRMKASNASDARTSTYSFKGVAWLEDLNVHYGQAAWDIGLNDTARLKLGGVSEVTHAGYTPKRNDLFLSGTRMMRVLDYLVSAKGTGINLYYVKTVTLEERNGTCKGSLSVKKYDYTDGGELRYKVSGSWVSLPNLRFID